MLDEERSLYKRLNKELVSFEEVTIKYDVLELKGLIQEHVAYTNSDKGKRILDHFSEYLPRFKRIVPHDYRRDERDRADGGKGTEQRTGAD